MFNSFPVYTKNSLNLKHNSTSPLLLLLLYFTVYSAICLKSNKNRYWKNNSKILKLSILIKFSQKTKIKLKIYVTSCFLLLKFIFIFFFFHNVCKCVSMYLCVSFLGWLNYFYLFIFHINKKFFSFICSVSFLNISPFTSVIVLYFKR